MSSEQANEDLNHDSDYQEYYDNFLREDYSGVENIEDVAAGVSCKLLSNLIKQVIDSIKTTEKLYPTLGTSGMDFCIEIYAGDPSKQQEHKKSILIEIACQLNKVPFVCGDLTGSDVTIVVPDAAHMLALVKLTETILSERIEVRNPLDAYGNELHDLRQEISLINLPLGFATHSSQANDHENEPSIDGGSNFLKKNPDIRFTNCDDSDFKFKPACQDWLSRVTIFVSSIVGDSPIIRIGAYLFGNSTFFTIDLFDQIYDRNSVAITIGLSGNSIYLPAHIDDQIDITLSGMADTLVLLDSLAKATKGKIVTIVMN